MYRANHNNTSSSNTNTNYPITYNPIKPSYGKKTKYWRNRHHKTSVVITLGIIGTILSGMGLVTIVYVTQNMHRPRVLLWCGVDNFMNPVSSRSPSHNDIAKCRFINLNPNWNYQDLGPCGFDTSHDYLYAKVPKSYQAKTGSSVEIFTLPCNYSINTYCPSVDIGNAHTSSLTVYPTGYSSIDKLVENTRSDSNPTIRCMMQCMDYSLQSIGIFMTLVICFIISITMVIYDLHTIIKPTGHYNRDLEVESDEINPLSIDLTKKETFIVYPDGEYIL